jgi:hypothetical protein
MGEEQKQPCNEKTLCILSFFELTQRTFMSHLHKKNNGEVCSLRGRVCANRLINNRQGNVYRDYSFFTQDIEEKTRRLFLNGKVLRYTKRRYGRLVLLTKINFPKTRG